MFYLIVFGGDSAMRVVDLVGSILKRLREIIIHIYVLRIDKPRNLLLALLMMWCSIIPLSIIFDAIHMIFHCHPYSQAGPMGDMIMLLLLFSIFSMPVSAGFILSPILGNSFYNNHIAQYTLLISYWILILLLHFRLIRSRRTMHFIVLAILILLSSINNVEALKNLLSV